jgi:hypothetical protein
LDAAFDQLGLPVYKVQTPLDLALSDIYPTSMCYYGMLSQRNLVLAAIAARGYTLKHGRPPQNLNELIKDGVEPRWLEDPVTGGTLRHKLLPDEDQGVIWAEWPGGTPPPLPGVGRKTPWLEPYAIKYSTQRGE